MHMETVQLKRRSYSVHLVTQVSNCSVTVQSHFLGGNRPLGPPTGHSFGSCTGSASNVTRTHRFVGVHNSMKESSRSLSAQHRSRCCITKSKCDSNKRSMVAEGINTYTLVSRCTLVYIQKASN